MTSLETLPPVSDEVAHERIVAPDEPARPRPRNRFSRPVVILPVVATVLAATLAIVLTNSSNASGPGPGEAIVTVHGEAFVARADGSSETTDSVVHLHPGDRIDLRRGSAEFELADSVRYVALAGRGPVPAASITMGRVPRLESGRLLVRAPSGAALHTSLADLHMRTGSIVRVAQSYAVTVGAYRGETMVSSAGVNETVSALRSVQAAAAGELAARRPIDVTGDAWDRTFLAPALALDDSLGPVAKAMRTSGATPHTVLDSARIALRQVPGRSEVAKLVAGRPARYDDAIGLVVVGNGTKHGDLADRWQRAIRFHDAGASWGLVAMDIGADPDRVLADLDDSLDKKVLDQLRDDRTLDRLIEAATRQAAADRAAEAASDGSGDGSGTDGSTGGSGSDGGSIPGVTTPTVTTPEVTVPGGITPPTTPEIPGVTTPGVTVPGVTTPAVPAVPVVPGVTTPSIPSTPVIPGVVTTVTGILTTLLPATTTTTTRPAGTTTTTLVGCVLVICL